MFKKLAIWYLRKKKCSILIGCKISNGQVKTLSKDNYIFDMVFNNVDFRLNDDTSINIPQGKFQILIPTKENGQD